MRLLSSRSLPFSISRRKEMGIIFVSGSKWGCRDAVYNIRWPVAERGVHGKAIGDETPCCPGFFFLSGAIQYIPNNMSLWAQRAAASFDRMWGTTTRMTCGMDSCSGAARNQLACYTPSTVDRAMLPIVFIFNKPSAF